MPVAVREAKGAMAGYNSFGEQWTFVTFYPATLSSTVLEEPLVSGRETHVIQCRRHGFR